MALTFLLVFTIPPQSIGHAVVSCRLALLMVRTWLLVPLCWLGEDGGCLRRARRLGPVGLVMVRYARRPIKSWCFHFLMSLPIHAAQCCIALCSRGWLFVSCAGHGNTHARLPWWAVEAATARQQGQGCEPRHLAVWVLCFFFSCVLHGSSPLRVFLVVFK